MKIRNFCFGLKNRQINYYLSKLPEVYRTCNIPIIFVPDNYMGYIIFKYYEKKYNLVKRTYREFDDIGGTHYHNNNESCLIYVKHTHKLSTPFKLFHELRHWYQLNYLKQYRDNAICNYIRDVNIPDYHKQPIEKDANIFSKKYCKLLGIKFEQSITNGYTICGKSSKLKEIK